MPAKSAPALERSGVFLLGGGGKFYEAICRPADPLLSSPEIKARMRRRAAPDLSSGGRDCNLSSRPTMGVVAP